MGKRVQHDVTAGDVPHPGDIPRGLNQRGSRALCALSLS